jgi:ATP-dependent protease ClpP protease subunit
MSLKKLPKINAKAAPAGVRWDAPSDAMSKWDSSLISAASDDATITMYDAIGSDGWSEGVTAKRVAAALRAIGSKDITVSLNSPGGDFFEGIAIYNLLREHPHKVTVKVVGLAASAASLIAMSGDDIQVAKTGFLMIHNAWVFAIGNRHDLRDAADTLDEFDGVMADLYADAAGITKAKAAKMMDDETWMSGQAAVDSGFATGLLSADDVVFDAGVDKSNAAVKKIDTLLAKQGLPRSERRSLIKEIKGTPNAATVTPSADIHELLNLTEFIKGFKK